MSTEYIPNSEKMRSLKCDIATLIFIAAALHDCFMYYKSPVRNCTYIASYTTKNPDFVT
jgi:hypothetical protein